MIFIQTVGGGAPLPFNADGSLDWESIEYLPTRQSIQNAWDALTPEQQQALIDQAIEEANTPPPEPEPSPNWQGFMDRLDLPTESNPQGTGLFAQFLGVDKASAFQAYTICLDFSRGFGGERELRTLSFIYLLLASQLDSAVISALQQAIADFHIPITL